MKRIILISSLVMVTLGSMAQQVWWVFLADKAGTTFDPYTYFDTKSIERYAACGADLYDSTNYPVNQRYAATVNSIATEEVGQSRWMNAIGVVASDAQVQAIAKLPFVLRVQPIESNMHLAQVETSTEQQFEFDDSTISVFDTQLIRMQGHLFHRAGFDGHGVRIAVFDGGFPGVNTHQAFKHIRDDGRILKTYNFPNHKENVYGWNSHGTMTLSCIAGRTKQRAIGLATGAEFLLARTEVEAEPFKEEVWWQQAMEWADKNGANIISSSLGYGKDRYYTRDMDGTSYVARAANMAARKGMLVVNSAGNEADDDTWQYIITPSDADSVLCIGGITYSLTDYEHISFASYGPSADGRQKPNLCAIAHTWVAAPSHSYQKVFGTSFSCPLVAGFAACAWQAMQPRSGMQLFDALQRSGDLYPYCDYAFGYGVPQASYFVGGDTSRSEPEPTFRFELESNQHTLQIIPLRPINNAHIFYKDIDDQSNRILVYGKRSLPLFDSTMALNIDGGHHIVVYLDGYTADYRFDTTRTPLVLSKHDWAYISSRNDTDNFKVSDVLSRSPREDIAKERRLRIEFAIMDGISITTSGNEMGARLWSPSVNSALRTRYHFSKAYSIGLGFEVGSSQFNYKGRANNDLENLLFTTDLSQSSTIRKRTINLNQLSLELFQRVRLIPGGLFHNGLHWDLGVYGSIGYSTSYTITEQRSSAQAANENITTRYNTPNALSDYGLNYGLATRLTYDIIGIYARYRLNGLGTPLPAGKVLLPRLEVGIHIKF